MHAHESPDARAPSPRSARFWRLVAAALGLAAVAGTVSVAGAGRWLDPATWAAESDVVRAFVAERPILAAAAWVALHGGLAAVSMPGAVWLCVAAGLVFGAGLGAVTGWLGLVVGSAVAFAAVRLLGGAPEPVARGERWSRTRAAIDRHGVLAVVLLRLSPVPYFLTTFAAAAFGMAGRSFVGATALGFAPGAFAYAALGAGAAGAIAAGPDDLFRALLADPWAVTGFVGLGLMGVASAVAARALGVKPSRRADAPVPEGPIS